MNREIKFRAWDESRKEMITEFGLLKENMPQLLQNEEDGYIFCGHSQDNSDWLEPILMQFTGLHDKNGKEIYEGDIYQTKYGQNYKIMFINGCFVGGKTDNFCSPMGWEVDVDGNDLIESNYCLQVEIIGNIYENPELCNP